MSYCKDIGLDLSSIFLEPSVQFCNKINKGAVIEIFNFGKSKQMEYMKIVRKLGKNCWNRKCKCRSISIQNTQSGWCG